MKFLSRKRSKQEDIAGSKPSFDGRYIQAVKAMIQFHGYEEAMRLAPGGQFDGIGQLERETLIHVGLTKGSYLVDVGCGSGRLAKALSAYLTGPYLGIDIVPDLVDYARRIANRPDWRFEVASGLTIPDRDAVADMICFFSVFTHLPHEQSYVYLREAMRVLKPDGKIIFSFLDFTVAQHWALFDSAISDLNVGEQPLTVFICKDMIHSWASHLGLNVQVIHDGDAEWIPLPNPVHFESGAVMEGMGSFGQSVCVLTLQR
jgi:ubiquinone/menaquinone biosynthesis C-methylase UbiE